MKKLLSILLCALMSSLLLLGCNTTNTSEKLTVTADGLTIISGETTLKEVLDQGYTYEFSKAFSPITEIEGKKFVSVCIVIKKDDKDFASVALINKSSSKKTLKECTISDIWFYAYTDDTHESKHNFSEIKINDENVIGLTKDQLTSKFDVEPKEYSDKIKFSYSGYAYEFKFDENNIVNFVGIDLDEYKQ